MVIFDKWKKVKCISFPRSWVEEPDHHKPCRAAVQANRTPAQCFAAALCALESRDVMMLMGSVLALPCANAWSALLESASGAWRCHPPRRRSSTSGCSRLAASSPSPTTRRRIGISRGSRLITNGLPAIGVLLAACAVCPAGPRPGRRWCCGWFVGGGAGGTVGRRSCGPAGCATRRRSMGSA